MHFVCTQFIYCRYLPACCPPSIHHPCGLDASFQLMTSCILWLYVLLTGCVRWGSLALSLCSALLAAICWLLTFSKIFLLCADFLSSRRAIAVLCSLAGESSHPFHRFCSPEAAFWLERTGSFLVAVVAGLVMCIWCELAVYFVAWALSSCLPCVLSGLTVYLQFTCRLCDLAVYLLLACCLLSDRVLLACVYWPRVLAAACASEPHFCQPSFPPLTLEPPPDLPRAAALPCNQWRPIPPHCKAARAVRAESILARGERGGGGEEDVASKSTVGEGAEVSYAARGEKRSASAMSATLEGDGREE